MFSCYSQCTREKKTRFVLQRKESTTKKTSNARKIERNRLRQAKMKRNKPAEQINMNIIQAPYIDQTQSKTHYISTGKYLVFMIEVITMRFDCFSFSFIYSFDLLVLWICFSFIFFECVCCLLSIFFYSRFPSFMPYFCTHYRNCTIQRNKAIVVIIQQQISKEREQTEQNKDDYGNKVKKNGITSSIL